MKSLTTRLLYIAINLFIVVGFILPFLISSDSTELVIIGLALFVADGIHLTRFTINTYKTHYENK